MPRFLKFVFLLRFPLLSAIALAALPLLYQVSLFRGFADLRPLSVGTVSLIAFLAAAAVMVNANLIFLYGEYRLMKAARPGSVLDAFLANLDGTATPQQEDLLRTRGLNPPHGMAVFLVGLGAWAVFIAATFHQYPSQQNWLSWWLGALAGLGVGIAIVLGATWLQLRETKPVTVGGAPIPIAGPFLVFPFQYRRRVHAFLHRTAYRKAPSNLIGTLERWLVRQLPLEGYAAGDPPELLPGHLAAVLLLAATLVVHSCGYLLGDLGITTWNAPLSAWPFVASLAPTLAYVVALILLFCWTMSGAGFFLDGFPFPTITVVLAVVLAFAFVWPNDNTFAVDTTNSDLNGMAPQTANYLAAIRGSRRVVVVAAAGGGIQAAGWTAQVLNGLTGSIPEFRGNVVALSSVSGGSVGAYTYVAGSARLRKQGDDVGGPPLGPGRNEDADPCPNWVDRSASLGGVTCSAMDSSLESAGWGLVHPDLARVLTGIPIAPDRGTALERSIAVHASMAAGWNSLGGGAKTGATLASPALQPEPGKFPVLLINTTSVDSGSPVVFTNSDFADRRTVEAQTGIGNFHALAPGADVQLPTAVRMSASFPYVSPAARANAAPPGWHLVDGGYYDNYGVATALRWLDQASFGSSAEVLLLRIEAFPLDPEPAGTPQHWPLQLIDPLLTLYTARGSAQQTRARRDIHLYEQIPRNSNFSAIMFRFNPSPAGDQNESPPLSWHLASSDKNRILEAWKVTEANGCPAWVKGFLEGANMPACAPPKCELLRQPPLPVCPGTPGR